MNGIEVCILLEKISSRQCYLDKSPLTKSAWSQLELLGGVKFTICIEPLKYKSKKKSLRMNLWSVENFLNIS